MGGDQRIQTADALAGGFECMADVSIMKGAIAGVEIQQNKGSQRLAGRAALHAGCV